MAAEIALSVLDHLESNLILPSSRGRVRWGTPRGRERNKNKVKCFN